MKEIKRQIKYFLCNIDEIISLDHLSIKINEQQKIIKTYHILNLQELTKDDIINLSLNSKITNQIFYSFLKDTKKITERINGDKILLLAKNKMQKELSDIEKDNNSFVLRAVDNIIDNINRNKITFDQINVLDRDNVNQQEYNYYERYNDIEVDGVIEEVVETNQVFLDTVVYYVLSRKIDLLEDLDFLEVILNEDIN